MNRVYKVLLEREQQLLQTAEILIEAASEQEANDIAYSKFAEVEVWENSDADSREHQVLEVEEVLDEELSSLLTLLPTFRK